MSKLTALLGVLVAALLVTMTPAPSGAQTFDKLANLTFTGPVQVPGATLPAGTYRFRLANPESSRNIIQVMSRDGSVVHAMFYTMSDRRMEVTEDAVLTFKETPAGVPPIARSLFYDNELSGYEFMYLGQPPVMRPAMRPQPPITYTRIPAATPPAPVAEPAPAPEPVFAEPAPPLAFDASPALAPSEVTIAPDTTAPAELPHTATLLPLFGAGGMVSLVLGLSVGLVRRRLV
jgi:hypothetical protein